MQRFLPLAASAPSPLWNISWEDDLIMSGVRSFDVKAYDNSFPGYVDLGWGDDLRLYTGYTNNPPTPPPFLNQTPWSTRIPSFTRSRGPPR